MENESLIEKIVVWTLGNAVSCLLIMAPTILGYIQDWSLLEVFIVSFIYLPCLSWLLGAIRKSRESK